jgi:transposase
MTPAAPPAGLIPDPRRPHLFRIPTDRPILALDVSKDRLEVVLTEPVPNPNAPRRTTRSQSIPNTEAAIQQLLRSTPAHACWVLEPTGRYGNLAVDLARTAQRTVLMAEPRRSQAYLRSLPNRAKTDRLDGQGLTDFAASQALPLYPRPSAMTEQAQQLLAARRGLSQSLARLEQQAATLEHAAPVLEPALVALKQQRAAVDRQLAELVAAHAAELGAAQRLDAVPGIGPVTATAVAACLQSRAFSHPDQFVAHVGYDLQVRDSGKKKGQREISHRGDAELRRLLYLAAQANLRTKASPFKAQYERERAKGLSHTAAVCAVARKLARVCWSLVKHGETYDPQRVHRQPQSPPPPPAPRPEA